jgi:hypothetical protein
MNSFTLEVSYTQATVFGSDLAEPFNDWSDTHVSQGFAWRQGSVSFKTLKSAGQMRVLISTGKPPDFSATSAIRIITVPFSVGASGDIEVATIAQSQPLSLSPGDYSLTFEHGLDSEGMWCVLHFEPASESVRPRIVRADSDLSPKATLLMKASPA